jgi:hypothetical protein
MPIPNDKEHKEIIEKNIKIINIFLLVSTFLLICILVFNKTNNSDNDTLYIFFLLIINLLTFYFCNINWNQIALVSLHYIYIIILFISILINNIFIIFYFIFVIISNMYIWYINTDCVFGGLEWGSPIIHEIGESFMKTMPFLYTYKFFKLFNYNRNNTNTINNANHIDNTSKIHNIITNNDNLINNIVNKLSDELINNIIPEKLFDSELFEIIHKKFS